MDKVLPYRSGRGQLDRVAKRLGFSGTREMLLDYRRRKESRRAFSARTGIPYSTLANAEKRFLEIEATVRIKDEVSG